MEEKSNKRLTQPLYVITCEKQKDRQERMVKRLKHHNLWKQSEIVNGPDISNPTSEYQDFVKGRDQSDKHRNCYDAVLFTYLMAFKRFLSRPDHETVNGMLTLEDDAMLVKDFNPIAARILSRKPSFVPLILFAPYFQKWICNSDTKIGNESASDGDPDMYLLQPGVFGSVAMWISKEYVVSCVRRMVPFRLLPNCLSNAKHSIEDFVSTAPMGVCVYPHMAVESCDESSGQGNDHLQEKRVYWGKSDYSKFEIPGEKVSDCWNREDKTEFLAQNLRVQTLDQSDSSNETAESEHKKSQVETEHTENENTVAIEESKEIGRAHV